jgi:hypothetical protein
MSQTAADQLSDEVNAVLGTLVPWIGVGADLDAHHRFRVASAMIAAELAQTDDDRLAAEACLSVMCALWPHGAPETVGRAEWWRTPLGQLCARSLAHPAGEHVTYAAAAAMLGVVVGTVAQMVSRGTLDRHPDGGVLRASVLQRLAR